LQMIPAMSSFVVASRGTEALWPLAGLNHCS
jgi:hypothetical protein